MDIPLFKGIVTLSMKTFQSLAGLAFLEVFHRLRMKDGLGRCRNSSLQPADDDPMLSYRDSPEGSLLEQMRRSQTLTDEIFRQSEFSHKVLLSILRGSLLSFLHQSRNLSRSILSPPRSLSFFSFKCSILLEKAL